MRSYTRGYSRTGSTVVVVDDTGALLARLPLSLPAEHYTTPGVVSEVKDRESREGLEALIDYGVLEVVEPPRGYIGRVLEEARRRGLASRLSRVDLEVLALALYLRDSHPAKRVAVASDDYAIQSLAVKLGIEVIRVRYPGVREARGS